MRRLITVLVLALASGCTAAQGAAALGTAGMARNEGCTGGRMVCRLMDRTCRTTGGPFVVPRSADEIEADRAAGLFGEFSGGEADAGTPDAGAE